jgi:predicted permease
MIGEAQSFKRKPFSLDGFWTDLRHTVRSLRRSLGFTATAVLTLALGIGATTAIFTLIQRVMLQSLPVVDPGQLWRVGDTIGCCHWKGYAQNNWSLFSWDAYKLFRANTPAFEELVALQMGNAELGVRRSGSSAAVATGNGEYVSGNFFRTFGISAWRGRLLTNADDQEGAPAVAVMSFRIWQSKYGSDPSVIGAAYDLNGHPFTIIGVTPPGFYGAKIDSSDMPDFWLPLTKEPVLDGPTARLNNPAMGWFSLIGRVRPGVNPKTLERQLQVELHQWLLSHRNDMPADEKVLLDKQTLHLSPGGAGVSLVRETYKESLRLLLIAAACVLLVACANMANLLLVRGLKDRPQTALQAALGASRTRLVWKALATSLTIALLGAAAGIAVAYGGARAILGVVFSASDTWVPIDPAPSQPVLLFTLGVTIVTGVACGVAPAWMMSRTDPIEALRGASWSPGGNRHWMQKVLVSIQAAISIVLVSAASMLGQSLHNLEHQNFGFETSGRYLVSINAKLFNYHPEQLVPLFREIEERLRGIRGVRSVSSALYAPMSGYDWNHPIRVAGGPEPGPADDLSSDWARVTPGFFETLGTKILMGRSIDEEDGGNTRHVAVINQAFAKKFFARQNPIGQHFGPAPRSNAGLYEVIGVCANMHYFSSSGPEAETPMYFVPQAQITTFDEPDLEAREIWSHYLYDIVIWAPGHWPNLESQVTRELANFDLVIYNIQPYSVVIHATFAQQNMIASLTWIFGAVALLLAAVGLYGLTAYGVEQRTGEIGVRMALGADRSSVVLLVLRRAFAEVGFGLVLGIPAAIGTGYAIAGRLFGVKPWDPLVLGGAALLLALAALVAAAVPARNATGVDPMRALRAE